MKTLPLSLLQEKNKLGTANAWLLLLDVVLPDGTTTFHFARNNEDVVWNGETYLMFPFEFEWPEENAKGELPAAQLLVSNVTRILMPYLRQFGGGVKSTVTVHVVNSGYLTADTSELSLTFSVMSAVDDAQWITWRLGMPNPLRSPFPPLRYIPGACRWVQRYKGAECAYSGPIASCNGTLEACRVHANSARFGAEPGLEPGGIRIA